MDRLLRLLLGHFVRRGTLRFTTARGSVFTVGDGSGPRVAIRFMTKAAERGVVLDPELKLGESYMDGTLQVEDGTIADLLAIVLGQTNDGMPPPPQVYCCNRPLVSPSNVSPFKSLQFHSMEK